MKLSSLDGKKSNIMGGNVAVLGDDFRVALTVVISETLTCALKWRFALLD